MPEAMKYDLVIATTLCFKPYGHVKDGEYRRKLWENMQRSLEKSDMSSMNILHVTNETDKGWNDNYLELLAFCKDQAPLCLIADSDGYFHPEWLNWLNLAMSEFPNASGWQLYKSPRMLDYDLRTPLRIENNMFFSLPTERTHASPHGLCFRTCDYFPSEPGEWFESFIGKIKQRHGMGFINPSVSLIQHCGQYGLNNIPGGSEDFDPNFPLNDECGLSVLT